MSSDHDKIGGAGYFSGRRALVAAACVAIVVAVVAGAARGERSWAAERALVMSDPDTISDKPALAATAMARGRAVFVANCASCHGPAGGVGRRAGVPDLTDRDFLYGEGRVSEIEDIVRHGIRAGDRRGRNFAYMPAYASARPYAAEAIPPLAPAEIRDVVQAVLRRAGRSADAGAATRGDAIFLGKGGCYDCHGADGRGDPAIGAPNLADAVWQYGDGSPDAIGDAIARGRKGYSPAYGGVLDAAASRAVAVYVASLVRPAPIAVAAR